MQTSNIMTGTLSAWFMALAYDWIEVATGAEFRALLYVAVMALVSGLYFGLRKNNNTEKGEA